MDISELKGEVKTWNLASDSKLLEYLQHFSSGVTDRTKSFAEKVDELTFDVADSEVSLKNTFNDFLMLGNSQFIENVSTTVAFFALFANWNKTTSKHIFSQRVYDDDEEEEEEAVTEPEACTLSDPFPNLKEAFSLGQEALKLFFVEDSPDEKFEVWN